MSPYHVENFPCLWFSNASNQYISLSGKYQKVPLQPGCPPGTALLIKSAKKQLCPLDLDLDMDQVDLTTQCPTLFVWSSLHPPPLTPHKIVLVSLWVPSGSKTLSIILRTDVLRTDKFAATNEYC